MLPPAVIILPIRRFIPPLVSLAALSLLSFEPSIH